MFYYNTSNLLQDELEQKQAEIIHQGADLKQMEAVIMEKSGELTKKDKRLRQKSKVIDMKNAKLIGKDEELLRMSVRLIVRNAEGRLDRERLRQMDASLQEKISELERKESHVISTENHLKELQVCRFNLL